MKSWGLKISSALAGILIASGAAAFADEPKLVPVTTSLSSKVISGYVDVAAEYNLPATDSSSSMDSADLNYISANVADASFSVTAVPEPSTLALAAIGLVGLTVACRSFRQPRS